ADLQAMATDSVGATYEVADQLEASGQATADQAEVLRSAGDAAFLPAFHLAAYLGLGLLLIALLIILIWLPAQAEAVEWKAGGTSVLPEDVPDGRAGGEPVVDPYLLEGDLDAAHQVHVLEEDPAHLSHVDAAPLEHPLGEEPPIRS
ncbi:MAG: hypothetical protein OEU98_02670, partial [Actinomycetota bacterium]|nr:hypothetical protein [Actinomycetota bacterium]